MGTLTTNTLSAWEVQLKPLLKTSRAHICLSELLRPVKPESLHGIDTPSTSSQALKDGEVFSEIMKLLTKACPVRVESGLKSISKKDFQGLLRGIDHPDIQKLNVVGDQCSIISFFKKIPFKIIESFVTRKTGGRYSIVEGKDVLVPRDVDVFFEINSSVCAGNTSCKKKIFIKAHSLNTQEILYAEFPLRLEKAQTYDINSGSKVSLLLNEDQIRVRFNGKALESGRIGDVIQVRSLRLKSPRSFRARIINRHTAEILP